MFFADVAYAMGAGAQGAEGAANPIMGMMPLILMFVIFYFLLIRPQQKKAKQHKEMLAALKKGDWVLTGGGFYGRIVEIREDELVVELGDENEVIMNRAFVSSVLENAPKSFSGAKNDKKKK
ncbi:preprotein translocase subunit YajC [Desulfobaculum xiamenense]|uniref:Sec translocon accessory complex subunit YajC n=1 Tax=Desulfobaculum xiamenense TaxID=995050 RepID=A0A846QL08_9BACT|nr:preprotein translocase subunit YajC [Desulfobaculum xiamenense]NJB66873.1 preprotein translocase subunit YajC [Desulfobaculum xiamenense]